MSSLSLDRLIFSVPSGRNLGLTPDTLNIREANFDVCTVGGVDIGSIVVDAAAHIAATSGVHGVVGNVVGTTDAQTLSNKTISTTSFFADSGDSTKRVSFNTSTATTGTTTTFFTAQTGNRVITFPDITDTVVTLTAPQALSNKSLRVPSTKLIDDVDATKRVTFDTSTATTGTTTTFFTSQTVDRSITFPNISDTVVTLTATQTLTNKTLTLPVIASISNSGTITLPTGTDTLVARATTDTLTNKTLTAPVIATISNGGTLTLPTGPDTLVARTSTDTLTNKTLTLPVIATISNGGTLTLPTGPDTIVARTSTDTLTNKTLTLPVIASISNGGTVTIPAGTDTFVTLTATQTLTNKTLTAPVIATISNSGTLTLPTGPQTIVGRTTTDTLTNKTLTLPIIASISNGGTITIPTGTDTLVARATTDTLTNKTLTLPVIASISNGGTITIPTGTDTLVGRATTDTLTNKTLVADNCSFQDDVVPGRILRFNLGGTNTLELRSSQTADNIQTFPNLTGEILLDVATQTITNKTLVAESNTITIAGNNITSIVSVTDSLRVTPTTNTVGVYINQANDISKTQNGLTVASNAVNKIHVGHDQSLNQSYINSTVDLNTIAGGTTRITTSASTGETTFHYDVTQVANTDMNIATANELTVATQLTATNNSTFNGPAEFNNTATFDANINFTNLIIDNTSTRAVCLDNSDLVVEAEVGNGSYTSTWTTTAGFSAFTNTISVIHYQRFGSTVTCTCVFDKATTAGGVNNTARVTIPINRPGPFATIQEAAGVLTLSPNPSAITMTGGFVKAVVGSTTQVELTLANISAIGDITVIGSFQYRLT
jgi:hypothetical protein